MVHDDDVVREGEDVVERVVPDGVMSQQKFGVGSEIVVDREDLAGQSRGDMFREDLRVVTHLLEDDLQLQHLVGDRVAHRRPRMELVDALVALHFVATIM